MAKRINIVFDKLGQGSLECVGFNTFRCLGKKGLRYPRDLTIDPEKKGAKKHPYFSQEYVCNYPGIGEVRVPCRMNYSVLIWGQRGIYIHEWPGKATYAANGGPTAGCIHVEQGDAKEIYDWVDDKTRVVIDYDW